MQSNEERRPFYVILGIPTDASQETVKKAYRQMALIHHPDKAGPEGVEQFKKIQAAYAVLGDPEKRGIYDRFGERGLDMPGIDQLAGLLGQQVSLSILFLTLILVYALLIIFLSFLCRRVQGHNYWKWTSVWIPLYILFGFIALSLLISLPSVLCGKRSKVDEELDAETDRPTTLTRRVLAAVSILIPLCWCIFIFCISAGLQRNMDGNDVNWWRYFVPVFIAEALSIFVFIHGLRTFADSLRERSVVPISDGVIAGLSISSLLMLFCRAAQLALIAAKVENTVEASWWVIFIPSYVFLGAFALQVYFTQRLQQPERRNAAYYCCLCCLPSCATIFIWGLPFASLIMIIAKLAGNGITLENALIPIFIILAFAVLVSIFGAIAMCCQAAGTSSDMRDLEEAGGDVNEPASQTANTAAAATHNQNAAEQRQASAITYDAKPAIENSTANVD